MDEYVLASNLILDVLLSKKTTSQALSEFPKNNHDINLKCAFDALVHYEADEDIRQKSADYVQIQDEYLEFIARTLARKEPLPQNVISRYYKYHKDNLISGSDKGFKSFMNYVKRMINF